MPVITFTSENGDVSTYSLSEATSSYLTCETAPSGCCLMCVAPSSLTIDCADIPGPGNYPFGGLIICYDPSASPTPGSSNCQTFVFSSAELPTTTLGEFHSPTISLRQAIIPSMGLRQATITTTASMTATDQR
ncbi:MAG: hypothetical protein IPL33_11395 [Sphingobacteriales bacterium]|nr:hypothetical protein [Sphingobacteriales bacterium]